MFKKNYFYSLYQITLFYQKNIKTLVLRKSLTLSKFLFDVIYYIIFNGPLYAYFYIKYFINRNNIHNDKKYYFLSKLILNDKSIYAINRILKDLYKIKDFRELPQISIKKHKFINDIEKYKIESYQFKNIYDYYLNKSSLIYAEYFRELYANSIISKSSNSFYLFDNNLISHFEIKSPLQTLNLIKKLNLKYTSKKLLLEISAICHLIDGRKNEANKLWRQNFNQSDFQYLDYIKDKTIAVVGPAHIDDSLGSEIDEYDIVVRPIFTSTESFDQKKYGNRTDVSYYNYGFYINANEILVESSKSLKWANIKPHKIKKTKLHCKSRQFNVVDTIYFSGEGNAIPNMIFDLIRFEPYKIKLFSSTLYLGSKTFADDFTKTYSSRSANNLVVSKNIRSHDPLSQFIFLKKGFRGQLFIADSSSESTLNLTCNEYLIKLMSKYSDSI